MMSPKKDAAWWKVLGTLALVGVAGFLVFRQLAGPPAPGEQTFFYDVSAAKIFRGPRTAAPPVRGIDGPEEDGYRALIISTNGRPEERSSWQVAYLEKFSPELKQATEVAQRTGDALAMGRLQAQAQRYVRRLHETEWHAMNTPEAEVILGDWARPGSGGQTPIVCTP